MRMSLPDASKPVVIADSKMSYWYRASTAVVWVPGTQAMGCCPCCDQSFSVIVFAVLFVALQIWVILARGYAGGYYMIERPVSECYNIRQNYNTYIGV